MEETLDDLLRRENADYLLKIGNLLSTSCPPASRFYISNLEKRLNEFPDSFKIKAKKPMYCGYCGSIWNSSNCKIRTQPPQHLNSHLKKLLKMERRENWKLNNGQKKKLRQFYNSTSKIVYRCLTCQKKTYFPGTKSNSSSRSNNTNATSTPKLKLNKSDVNAGLFIASPVFTNVDEKSNLDKSEISTDNNTKMSESSFTSLNTSKNTKESANDSSKHEKSNLSFKTLTESSSKKQSSIKRKQTLLAEILDQEQSKKKKSSLSSFLVSL